MLFRVATEVVVRWQLLVVVEISRYSKTGSCLEGGGDSFS